MEKWLFPEWANSIKPIKPIVRLKPLSRNDYGSFKSKKTPSRSNKSSTVSKTMFRRLTILTCYSFLVVWQLLTYVFITNFLKSKFFVFLTLPNHFGNKFRFFGSWQRLTIYSSDFALNQQKLRNKHFSLHQLIYDPFYRSRTNPIAFLGRVE